MGVFYRTNSYRSWCWIFKTQYLNHGRGLYQKGDNKRDTGFYIFYMGINIGAFLGALTVGAVAAKYGWHYGFGLAGIGMAIGQLVYFYGLQYLEGVGEFIGSDKSPDKELMNKPLTKVEKDRMLVMFLSFLIIIVFGVLLNKQED